MPVTWIILSYMAFMPKNRIKMVRETPRRMQETAPFKV